MSIEAVRVVLALVAIIFVALFWLSAPPHHIASLFACLSGMAVGCLIGSAIWGADRNFRYG